MKMRHHYTPRGVPKIQKTRIKECGTRIPFTASGQPLWETVWQLLTKLKISLPAVTLPDIYPK